MADNKRRTYKVRNKTLTNKVNKIMSHTAWRGKRILSGKIFGFEP